MSLGPVGIFITGMLAGGLIWSIPAYYFGRIRERQLHSWMDRVVPNPHSPRVRPTIEM